MPYRALIFDFDGTISDSSEGIYKSMNIALMETGYPMLDMTTLRRFLGASLQQSIMDHYNLSMDESRKIVDACRKKYIAGNCFKLHLYDGVEKMLQNLRSAGLKIGIASSKPTVYLEKILQNIQIGNLFDAVCGIALNSSESCKSEIIKTIMSDMDVSSAECLVVGDRRFDIEGATMLGIQSIGVLYGYGEREELEKAGATWIVGTCVEIEAIVLESLQVMT